MRNNIRLKQFITGLAFVATFLIALSTGDGVAHADDSNIVFDKTQFFPVVLAQNTDNIQPGLATVDMNKMNIDHDPEAIKAFMQQIAPQYGIDWRLVYAIGVYESGNYSSNLARNNNNFFGRKASATAWMKYATAEDGIRDQFDYLKTNYIDNGLNTPQKMNRVYCVGTSWQYMVQTIINTV